MLTYEEKKPFSVQHRENQSHVTAVAMSPDGSVIVTGEPNGNLFNKKITRQIAAQTYTVAKL
jgi:uncharacterized membrane protein